MKRQANTYKPIFRKAQVISFNTLSLGSSFDETCICYLIDAYFCLQFTNTLCRFIQESYSDGSMPQVFVDSVNSLVLKFLKLSTLLPFFSQCLYSVETRSHKKFKLLNVFGQKGLLKIMQSTCLPGIGTSTNTYQLAQSSKQPDLEHPSHGVSTAMDNHFQSLTITIIKTPFSLCPI